MSDPSTESLEAPSGPRSVRDLWEAEPALRHRYLARLIPGPLLDHYGLGPPRSWSEGPEGVFRCLEVPGEDAVRLEVWPDPAGEDPALVLELTDTYLGHLEASWIVINDIHGPRFHVDRDPQGNPIPLGSTVRNLREEIRALAAGLAPNQVRPGLRMFRHLIRGVEAFARTLGVEILYVAPLAYHNAIKYEQYGFTYSSGQEQMEWIHREFQPGGVLRARMDGSRPFRMPWMSDTVRGRSWAVHDGVLGRRWMAPQMYKFVSRDFHIRTFPNAVW
ncbi:MAG: hypothetical protein GXP50_08900 [Deltaproteobacteria bacterium]|nr:hypothetical protein [Deltaproteobacteria bacterium]